ncbi:CHASE domain-containing protein [Caldimonas brevitalea]|uniref:Virulence sensor protein BvgS n=1 Tax=Caldimonas brevitalea TaxID=413882 RepID=A0A0G3BDA6_9BURK|nr:CHASE domain-containing protein [Caldimonas brevitalea]AKJ27364.1 sensory box histidine kinase/response regulator [Caldimonas brevitalea]
MSERRYPTLLCLAVFMAGLLVAAAVGWARHTANQAQAQARFDAVTRRATADLQTRMAPYAYGLRGAGGAVIAAGGEAVTRERFRQYSATRQFQREFRGSRGFGFVRRVPRAEETVFLAAARRDGQPDFRIHELSPHEGERYVIQYIEPVELNLQAIGLDIASEGHRRAAAIAAMRSGKPALTAPITLVQASGLHRRSFLLLLPIFQRGHQPATVAERETACFGWAYMPLAMDEVLGDFNYSEGEFALALYDVPADGTPERFFTSPGWDTSDTQALSRRLTLPMYGRQWQMEVRALPAFFANLQAPDPRAYAGAVAATFALAAVLLYVWLLGAERERLVRTQQARMAAMVDSSQDAIVGISLQDTVTDWNRAAERIFGYTAAQALQRRLVDLIVPPERMQEEMRLIEQAAQGEDVPVFDTVRLRQDGGRVDVSVSLSPIRSADGRITGAAKTLRDISRRKAAEAKILDLNATLEQQVSQRTAQLRALAARERAILGSAASAIIATDTEGVVVLFNPAAEAMLGWRAADVIGRLGMAHFHDPGELQAREQALAAELGRPLRPGEVFGVGAHGGPAEHREWTYVRQDGTRLPVLLSVSAVRDDAGHNTGFMAVAVDLSERKRLERELLDLNQALTERSVQAEAATQAKSAFLANMSHEIRTPMNAIIGLTQLMRRDSADRATRERLDMVIDASRHLLAIINNVLDLSKIEVGKLALEQTDFDLDRLLARTCALVRTAARDKGVELVLDLDDTPSCLIGDPTRLEQALLNLVGNAVKFTPTGSIVVRCRCIERREQDLLVRFEVVDTGIGVPSDAIDKVFGAFEQGDNSTTRRYGGTGLGLTITRQLAQLMGGDTGASSQAGAGSTFWFSARLRVAPPNLASATAAAPVLDGRRALIVEDLDAASQALGEMLKRLGVRRADRAASSARAVEMARAAQVAGEAYDVLLIDCELPARGGLHLARELLRGDAGVAGGAVCLLLTLGDADAVRAKAGDLQGVCVLEKPVSMTLMREGCIAAMSPAAGLPAALPAEGRGALQEPRFEGARVLLAEDNPVNQLVAVEQLQSLGLEVDLAPTGVAAVEQARAARYDLILMDLHMPEMDGLTATREIRRLAQHRSTPILAMTASAFGEDRDACLAAGMDDHISKPVETSVLIRTLGRWLGSVADAAARGPQHPPETGGRRGPHVAR